MLAADEISTFLVICGIALVIGGIEWMLINVFGIKEESVGLFFTVIALIVIIVLIIMMFVS